MKPAPFLTARNVLLFSLAAEAVTALAVIVAPGLVAQLLLHADISGTAIVFGRLLGVALLALVVACWPGAGAPGGARATLAVFAYNLLAALYLAYLGVTQRPAGILMWPAAVEHALVTLLLLKPALHGRAAPVG